MDWSDRGWYPECFWAAQELGWSCCSPAPSHTLCHPQLEKMRSEKGLREQRSPSASAGVVLKSFLSEGEEKGAVSSPRTDHT